jgi:hypothetical protein
MTRSTGPLASLSKAPALREGAEEVEQPTIRMIEQAK